MTFIQYKFYTNIYPHILVAFARLLSFIFILNIDIQYENCIFYLFFKCTPLQIGLLWFQVLSFIQRMVDELAGSITYPGLHW